MGGPIGSPRTDEAIYHAKILTEADDKLPVDVPSSQIVVRNISIDKLSCTADGIKELVSNLSLTALMKAASHKSLVNAADTRDRNAQVDTQITAKKIRMIDISSNEYCYFRAIPVYLNEYERIHMTLRQAIVLQLVTLQGAESDERLKNRKLRNDMENLKQSGIWVGEDIILTTAAYHQRDVQVNMARNNLSQLIFRSFAHAAPFLWNHLPNTVRSAPTYLSFRKSLKTYFFNQAFPTQTVFPVLI